MGYRDYQCVFVTIWIVESFERATDMYIYNGHGVYKYVYRVIVSRVSFVFRIVTRGTMFLIFHCIVLVYLNTIRNYFQVS